MSRKFFKAIITVLVSNSLIMAVFLNPAEAYMQRLSPQSFSTMYNLAAKGDVASLDAAIKRGLNINAVNENGDTALCVAVKKRDARAYNTLRGAGAAPRPQCSWKISHWDSFVNSSQVKSGALWQNSNTIRQGSDDNYGVWPWVIGAGAVGVAALIFSGGGGGGSSSDSVDKCEENPCNEGCFMDMACQDNEVCAEKNVCGGCIRCEQKPATCEDNPCMDGCFENLTCASNEVCTEKNECGGCSRCEQKPMTCEDNPCMDGCYTNLTCPYGCAELNSCGGCQSCLAEPIEPQENFVISTQKYLYNNEDLVNTGKDRTEVWGGIYTNKEEVHNEGNIVLAGGKQGVGILSCSSPSLECMTSGDTSSILGKDIVNHGNITVTSDESVGIFASNLVTEQDNRQKIDNRGTIILSGADNTGIVLMKKGLINNTGDIFIKGTMTKSADKDHWGNVGIYYNQKNVYYGDTTQIITNNANISLDLKAIDGAESLSAYGMYLYAGRIGVNSNGNIDITFNGQSGNNDKPYWAYGISHIGSPYGEGYFDFGEIHYGGDMTIKGNTAKTGIYKDGGDLYFDKGTITIESDGTMPAYGIYSHRTKVSVDGNIQMSSVSKTSKYIPYAIYAYGNDDWSSLFIEGTATIDGNVYFQGYGYNNGIINGDFQYYFPHSSDQEGRNFKNYGVINGQVSLGDGGTTYVTLPPEGTFLNSGTISNKNSTMSLGDDDDEIGNGIYFSKVYDDTVAQVVNDKNAKIEVEFDDIDVYGLNLNVGHATNHGTIQAISNNKNAVGIYQNDQNDFTNSATGTILAKGNSAIGAHIVGSSNATNAGKIEVEAENSGIGFSFSDGQSGNDGTIKVKSGKEQSVGALIDEGGLFVNNGTIDVTLDSGRAYGILKQNKAKISFNKTSKVNVTLNDTGTAYGIYNDIGSIGSSSAPDILGNISVTGGSDGQLYGVYNTSGDLSNAANITVKGSTDNTSAIVTYGIYHDSRGNVTSKEGANIKVQGYDVYGMWIRESEDVRISSNVEVIGNKGIGLYLDGVQGQLGKEGIVNVKTTERDAYGLYILNGANFYNRGNVTVQNLRHNATGVHVKDSTFTNTSTGSLIVQSGTTARDDGIAAGIYADNGRIINEGNIHVKAPSDQAYGIYAKNGSVVENKSTIWITTFKDGAADNKSGCEAEKCDGSKTVEEDDRTYIYIDSSSTFVNAADFISDTALDFDAYQGTFVATTGAKFKAPVLKGNLQVAADSVASGFKDQYQLNDVFEGDQVNVNAYSGSAMFNAVSDGKDITLERIGFNELSSGATIANYLEANYQKELNEDLYKSLKKASDLSAYRKMEAELLGYQLLPNFSQENMTLFRNLNTVLSDELFKKSGIERTIAGFDHQRHERNTKGVLTGYENYANTAYVMYDRLHDSKLRTGLGVSLTQFRSDYDDDSSRKEVMAQILAPVTYEGFGNLKLASIARFGYGNGDYKRRTRFGSYEADLSEWIYGLSNRAQYDWNVGLFTISPVAEFNFAGYYQNRIREDKDKTFALKADAQNNLSIEGGVGLDVKKEIVLDEHNKFKLSLGGMYYHEFSKPYHTLDAHLYGMNGTYKITDYEDLYDNDRGVIRAGFDYDWKKWTFYGKFNQYIEHKNPYSFNVGMKYKF